MIGADNSPMKMFNVGGDAFQRGRMIGAANSPFSSVTEAVQDTLAKYDAHRAMQAEHANKVDLLKQQYGMMGDNLVKGIKEKYTQSAPQLSDAEKALYDPLHPEKNTVKISGVEMYREPVYDTYGRIKGFKLRNPRALSFMDIIGQGDQGATTGVDGEVQSTLKDIEALQAQLPQEL